MEAHPAASNSAIGAYMVMDDEQLLAAIAARGEGADEKSRSGRFLLITGALFLVFGGFYWGWEWVALITVAIALHEIGHVIAMRLFGYKNVRMLFIPLFGGLASGEPRELDATKNAVVSLAGPAFGMLTAVLAAVAALFLDSNQLLVNFAWASITLNGFNLLPLVPLDGGQFANDTLFSRRPILELLFRLLAIAGLGYFAWTMQAVLLGALALFMLIGAPAGYRRAKVIKVARDNPAWRERSLDKDTVVSLRALAADAYSALPAQQFNKKLPELAHGIWLEINKRFPGPGGTVGLVFGYVLLVASVVVCAMVIARVLPQPGP